MIWFKQIAARLGVDRAVAYAIFARLWSVAAGPVSVLLIVRCLTVEEQGFYYTFGSLLAVQMFFELGLTNLLVTFAAHEKASLSWTEAGILAGEPRAESRLRSLLHSSLRWYAVAAVGFVAVTFPLGWWFFGRHGQGVASGAWLPAWIGMVVTTALSLVVVPCVATLEGCGLIQEINLVRLKQTVVSNAIFWAALLLGGGLFGAFLSTLGGWLVMAGWLFHGPRRRALWRLWREPAGAERIGWWREVWPMQWKLALSWMSGYFIFQLFNPVLFLYHGPQAAARMGLSLNLTGRITDVALTWIATKAPTFASLVAARNYKELDRMFFKVALISVAVNFLGGATLWGLALGLQVMHHPYGQRLLDLLPLGFLVLAVTMNHIVFCQVFYMRAHKEEPLLGLSLVSGPLVGGLTYFFGRHYGAMGMMIAYFFFALFGLGAATIIFYSRWRRWHADAVTHH